MTYSNEKPAELPRGLIDLDTAASRVGLRSARLDELCRSGHAPHWEIDGHFRFQISKLSAWVRENLSRENAGIPFQRVASIYLQGAKERRPIPLPLTGLVGLLEPHIPRLPTGVYFLVRGDVVVYVGQSVNPVNRIGDHVREGHKTFDRCFLLPIPQGELNRVEAAFIRSLRPEFNFTRDGRLISPASSEKPDDVVKGFRPQPVPDVVNSPADVAAIAV